MHKIFYVDAKCCVIEIKKLHYKARKFFKNLKKFIETQIRERETVDIFKSIVQDFEINI